jgi:diguanylate cyclase (GGDEF)-like protein
MVNLTGIVDEVARLDALRALDMLDTPPEAEFDAIAVGARHLFGCKFAFVSLVDADRQWFKAACGLEASETPRDVSFCTHTIAADDLLVIADTRKDLRFATNPMVVETPFVRFYAGVPLRVTPPGGGAALPIGTLCVADDKPQDPTREKLEILAGMARVVEALLEARRTSKENLQLALDRAREGAPLAIAIIDLNRFKEVNDRLGHATGDKVLQVMAAKLQAVQYLGDHFIGRLGGDEFVLILRGRRTQEELVQDIARLLADLRYAVPDDRSVITVSATIGACVYGASYVDRASLLKEADEALYRAKRMQRGTAAIAGNSAISKVWLVSRDNLL